MHFSVSYMGKVDAMPQSRRGFGLFQEQKMTTVLEYPERMVGEGEGSPVTARGLQAPGRSLIFILSAGKRRTVVAKWTVTLDLHLKRRRMPLRTREDGC